MLNSNKTREQFKSDILLKFKKKESVAIYAPQNVGKTYILKELYNTMVSNNSKCIYLNLDNIFTVDELYSFFKTKTKEILNIHFDDMFGSNITKIEYIFETFCKIVEEKDEQIYFFIDNFCNYGKLESINRKNEELIEIFNRIFVNCQNIIFCFTIDNGYGIDLFEDYRSELYAFCKVITLYPMSEKEIMSVIVNLFNKNNIEIDTDVIMHLMAKAHNTIYYTTKICEVLKFVNKKSLTKRDIDVIVQNLYCEFFIENFVLKLNSVRGKKYLTDILWLIANDRNPYDLQRVVGSKGNIAKLLGQLERDGYIIKIKEPKNAYIIFDPFLKKYILENFVKDVR